MFKQSSYKTQPYQSMVSCKFFFPLASSLNFFSVDPLEVSATVVQSRQEIAVMIFRACLVVLHFFDTVLEKG